MVIYNDYPHAWPDLILLIVQNYSSQEQPRLYGALTALRILSNKYEFKDEDERQPIQEVVNLTFPALLQIFQVHPKEEQLQCFPTLISLIVR